MQGIPLTAADKQKFLAKLRASRGNVSRACKAILISRNVAYAHKKSDADFSNGWDEVLSALVDEAEQEVHARAVKGWREPVFHQGAVVGHIIKKSDRLLEFYLKGNRPEKYRERIDLSATHAGSLDVHLQASIDKAYDEPDATNPPEGAAFDSEDDSDGESGGGA